MVLSEEIKKAMITELIRQYKMNRLQAISLIFDVYDCLISLGEEVTVTKFTEAVVRFANAGLYFRAGEPE